MKRVFYIIIAVFALVLASCSKQDIQPTSDAQITEPTWRHLGSQASDSEFDPSGTAAGGITITDPNVDPSEIGGKN